MKNPPSFQFYPKDFLTDYNVLLMSNEQVGCYWKLCCLCWIEGSLPEDPPSLARLLSIPEGWFNQNWKSIEVCFKKSPSQPGRLIHPRLEISRQQQIEWRLKSSDGGIKSGKSRRYLLKGGLTTLEPRTGRVVEPKGNHLLEDRRQETGDRKGGKEKSTREEKPRTFTSQDCELIYQAYPKKIGRGKALEKIREALAKILPDHPTDAVTWLLSRTREYTEIVRGRDPQFIPYPATWFHQERYEDDFEILKKEKKSGSQFEKFELTDEEKIVLAEIEKDGLKYG